MKLNKEYYINSKLLFMSFVILFNLILITTIFLDFNETGIKAIFSFKTLIGISMLIIGIPILFDINKQYKTDYEKMDKTIQPRNVKEGRLSKILTYIIYLIGVCFFILMIVLAKILL